MEARHRGRERGREREGDGRTLEDSRASHGREPRCKVAHSTPTPIPSHSQQGLAQELATERALTFSGGRWAGSACPTADASAHWLPLDSPADLL